MVTHGKCKNKARELISCKPCALKLYFVIGQGKNIPACEKIEMPGSWSSKVLRTFAPIATAHRYCARKFTRHVMHRARALRFLSTGHRILPSCDCKVRETMVAKFELVL